MKRKSYALISTFDKEKIEQLCEALTKYKINIISTESTSIYIKKYGFKCHSVSKFTKFKEILDGRVKTLHPKIHASLLFNRDKKNHKKQFNELGFPTIDFLIVNLYPFPPLQKKLLNFNNYIEMIDIGGPALLRSAAKNYNSVTVISDKSDYNLLIDNLNKNNGSTTLRFRQKMAAKAFAVTSSYDFIISNKISNKKNFLKIYNHENAILRYGENPHQKAHYFKNLDKNSFFDNIVQLGKKLSYNNILDVDSAFDCISEFNEPTCVIVKHCNPCGVSSNKNILRAFKNALTADATSAFGSIVAINRHITTEIANSIISNYFEIILAPSFSKSSINIFKKKKKLTLIQTKKIKKESKTEIKSINGAYLVQEQNLIKFNTSYLKCVTKKKASIKQIDDLVFGFKVCKHIKSNAIVLVKNKKTIGIGAGQMSRIDATKISVLKINKNNKKINYVAASDAFFPFIDNVQFLLKNNCRAIVQPSGSMNDHKIIDFANKYNLPLYFSKYRFFKH